MSTSEKRLFLGLLLLAIVLISRGPNSMSGDAPHYLAVSHSLVHDLDFDLSNQYAPETGYLFYPGDRGGHAIPGREGRIYPFHYVGLSVAIAPVFALAEGLAKVVPAAFLEAVRWDKVRFCRDLLSLAMAALYAWTAVVVLRTARQVCRGNVAVLPATILAFAAPPLLSMSILVFTEVPAAFLLAGFVSLAIRSTAGRELSVVPLSLLPWLHLRYWVVSLVAFVWLVSLIRRNAGHGFPLGSLARLVLVPVISLSLLCFSHWWMFDTWFPFGQYVSGFPLTMDTFLRGLAGQLVDRDFGLLAVAPFWAIAWLATPRPRFLVPRYAQFVVAAFLGTWVVASLNPMWWGGFSPPTRFMVPVLPLFVPLLAEGLQRFQAHKLSRPIPWLYFAWAFVVIGLLVAEPQRLWVDPQKDLGLMVSLPTLHRLWPSLLDPGVSAVHVLITLALVCLPCLPALFPEKVFDGDAVQR